MLLNVSTSPQVFAFVVFRESYPGRPPAMDLAAAPGSGTAKTCAHTHTHSKHQRSCEIAMTWTPPASSTHLFCGRVCE